MSLGLLVPGQGSQHAAMLPWLDQLPHPPPALDLLRQALGDDWRQRLADPTWAQSNAVAQALITGVVLVAWQHIQALLPTPAVVAGYSVGELAAFCIAGVFDAPAAMRLAGPRAALMDAAPGARHTGLLSVSGAAPGLIAALCQAHGLHTAIQIGSERCVLGGPVAALAPAEQQALAQGASCQRLPVALASHTPCLDDAVAPLAALLAVMDFAPPRTALVVNLSGQRIQHPDGLRQALAQQLANTVRWDRCMDAVAERGVRCVLELGPGSALARLWKARQPQIPVRSLDDFARPEGAARWVIRTLADAR